MAGLRDKVRRRTGERGQGMSLRQRIDAALKDAMKARDSLRLSTLRLITAAIRDRDIALRGEGREDGMTEAEIQGILSRMVRQRNESAASYEEAARLDLAEQERTEAAIVQEFLPRALSKAETDTAIDAAIAELGATSIRDMGRVMALLKDRHAGQLDLSTVGARVKDRLAGPASGA